MLHDWGVIATAFAYIGLLFFIASRGDRMSAGARGRASQWIYPLSLAIYCTSWTFFGSVGFATRTSIDFLAIYVGPIVMIGLCTPLLRRVIALAKSQNITSIADFIAARYGKSQKVAATVALIAIIGSVPYIALQLKAMASSLETILSEDQAFSKIPVLGDIALMVTLAMAVFAVLFGTRHTNATEHQHGLILAIAAESIVKLVAFIAAGAFVTFWMFSPVELYERALMYNRFINAPTSIVGHDDLEMYERAQEGLKTNGNQWVNLRRLYESGEEADVTAVINGTSERQMRNQFHAWAKFMTMDMVEPVEAAE